jgi:hypothetical protein
MRSRVVYHVARADFLERVRRYSFLVTLLFAVYLGYAAATGKIGVRLGVYRGVYTSGWIGANMALVATCFISLVGFYIVKNAIERDRVTRVGEILAATPLTKSAYALGKWLSNTAVLAAQVVVLALASIFMQFAVGEDAHRHLWALLAPFLLLALPAISLTGAVALLFETMPVLRGGVGNVVWFFAWATGIGLAGLTGREWLDFSGLLMVMNSITRAARTAIPGYGGGFAFQVSPEPARVASSLRWAGLQWDLSQILLRLEWIAVALALVQVATFFFDRFDPARSRALSSTPPRARQELKGAASDTNEPAGELPLPHGARAPVHLTPLVRGARGSGFHRMLAAELTLAFKGYPWWWYAVAIGLVVAQCAAPINISRGPLLTVSWIWPILLWSPMGAREARHGTEQLIFSAARILPRQLPACWLAGVTIAAGTGAGAAIRLLLAGSYAGLLAWVAGALFIPTLALSLGIWTGSSRAFEGLFTGLWYIGPLNRVPGFDFTGAANGARTNEYTAIYLALTAALLTAALLGRTRQLRHA